MDFLFSETETLARSLLTLLLALPIAPTLLMLTLGHFDSWLVIPVSPVFWALAGYSIHKFIIRMRPNETSDATPEPAPGADSSADQG